MKITLKILEEFVTSTKFSKEPLQLDQCTLINDRKKFAQSHLDVLKANSGNKTMTPYWDRLVKFYNLIKDDN